MVTKAEINFVRSLADRRARRESGLFVAEGEKLVRDLAASPLRVVKIYCAAGFSLPGAECVEAGGKDMERMSGLKTPSDVVALVEIPRRDDCIPGRELTLALDGVQDPGNMGTIIRTADWFGVRHIICSENSADCFNPKVVQATMGAIARVAVHYGNLADMLSRAEGPVYGTFLEGEDVYGAGLPPSGVVVMGSEGRGISPQAATLVTRKLYIPPFPAGAPGPESLNVAVAAAVILSEIRRRQTAE